MSTKEEIKLQNGDHPAQSRDSLLSPEEREVLEFAKRYAYTPWKMIVQYNRGEISGSTPLPPLFNLLPPIPVKYAQALIQPIFIRLLFGKNPNMITIILNKTRNSIVFMGAEKFENKKYDEFIRIDQLFTSEELNQICRSIQTGFESEAYARIWDKLRESGLERFKPGLLKISDLYFFELLKELSELKERPAEFAQFAAKVVKETISYRLVYFYPEVPLEYVLKNLNRAINR